MNELDFTRGKYRPTVCEWLSNNECKNPLVPGASYCAPHMELAYHPKVKAKAKARVR